MGPADRIRATLETAQTFFRERLHEAEGGSACRAYLERRGLSDETAERLGLGWAPDSWEALRTHLVAKRFTSDEMQQAGLVMPRKSGTGQYDRFRGRLIFPIRDLNGRALAFGGRTIGDAEPKYINSPETPVYTKGNNLYGLDRARDAIRREGFVVVVEGYLDLAAVVQAGFENVVATLGTAFTPAQAQLLSRFTRRVVFSYDGDSAGATATARSLDMLLTRGFEVRVVELPSGCDPDDFIRREGAAAYGDRLRAAPGYLQFLIDRQVRDRELDRIEEQVAAVNAVLPHIAQLGNSVERAQWSQRLADAMHVDDELVRQELRAASRKGAPRVKARPAGVQRMPTDAESRLVHRLIDSEDERQLCCDQLEPRDLDGSPVAGIVQVVVELTRGGEGFSYAAVLDALDDDEQRQLLTKITFRDEPDEGPGVADCLQTLHRRRLERDRRSEGRKLATAGTDVDQHLRRIQELARQRDALS